ncbi:MAG: helix-turn-helix domain-containing protein [Bacteroides sp.]|nr:helix-turn-helix domain-containing protein [Bacteroides sp.]
MRNLLKNLLILLSLWISVAAYSYPTSFRNLTMMEGLSDLLVNAIYKDSLGYVWIGTGNSLERFDGVHLKRYPIKGTDEKLKRVSAIAELPGNEIWMGNGMGLWRVNKQTETLERISGAQIDMPVHSLFYDARGTLYIGTGRGLYIYRSGMIERLLVDANSLSAANVITDILQGEDKLLWLATGGGLFSLNLSDGQITGYHNQKGDEHVCVFRSIARTGHMLYLATQNQGIVCFDTRSGRFERYVDVGCNVISSLSSNGTDRLYVGTDGNGIHFIDTRKNKIVQSIRHEAGKESGLHSNSVYSLLVDREGIVWVGFYQQGLDYTLYQNDLFTPYAFQPHLNTMNVPVRALQIHGDEKLIGSRDGLFYIHEKSGIFKEFKSPQLRSSMIFSILRHRDEYYIGTYGGGMYILNPRTLTIRDFDAEGHMPFSQGQIFCIKEDAEGTLWIGTSVGIYCYKDGLQTAHYNSTNSKLPAGNVYEIYFDSTRKGWICTENGVCIWDPSARALRTDVFPAGFMNKEKIRVVYEDSDHCLYFFPDKGNMFISNLEMTNFRPFRMGTPLDGRNGMFVIEDREGWLWIGTDKGLFRYDKKERFISYGFVDGISNPVFTLYPPTMDREGNLWFTNTKGLLHLDMNRLYEEHEYAYPLTITEMRVNGNHSIPLYKKHPAVVKLESSQRNLVFSFSDFSYTDPLCMSYEYRLEGEDKEWVTLDGKSDVAYYNLSSGQYTFKLRKKGIPESEVQLPLEIASTGLWGVLLLLLLIFCSVGWFSMWYRNRRKGKQAAMSASWQPEEVELPVEESKSTSKEKYKTNRISPEECRRLAEKLEKYMQEEKPYTNPNLRLGDLATALGSSSHTLSYLLSQHLHCSYYDYVTNYRIGEFKRLVKNGEYAKYTLNALAELCGFNSKASFHRSFKNAVGMTPNEYIVRKGQ